MLSTLPATPKLDVVHKTCIKVEWDWIGAKGTLAPRSGPNHWDNQESRIGISGIS